MSRRSVCLAIFVTLCAGSAWGQPVSVSDFPPHDHSIVITPGRDGGRALADALRARPPRAAALAVLIENRYVDESLDVLSRVVAADDGQLLPALEAANASISWWEDQRRREEINTALTSIADRATVAVLRRPRGETAEIMREVWWLQMNVARGQRIDWTTRLREFISTYAGTPAALVAEAELIARTPAIPERIQASEQFAREHPGTVAGARALFEAAFQLAHNVPITGIEARGSDPTARLLRVSALARELESGRYPPCEWVERAPQLVTGFFVADMPSPSYAEGNVQRSLDEYARFIRSHLLWQDPFPPNDPIAWMVSRSMWKLWSRQGDPLRGAERFFDGLAADSAMREQARFLQARALLDRTREAQDDAPASRRRAIVLLTDLARSGSNRVRSRAHAILAAELFAGGENERACAEFRRFADTYPRSDWAWVASLRAGICEESLQHWDAAAVAYRRAVTRFRDTPAAALLGHAYAARVLEGTGNLTAALDEYQQAITSWFGKEGSRYVLYTLRRTPATTAGAKPDAMEVTRPALESKREQLRATLAVPGGALLARARWTLTHGSRQDARAVATQLMRQFPGSPLVPDARYLVHRADYEDALQLAAADNPRDVPGALEQFERLSREPWDVVVSLAKVARASVMAVHGPSDPDALMRDALEQWRTAQRQQADAAPGSLEADADAVRHAVFRPLGGGIFQGGWNAMAWPVTLPPYLLAPAMLPVHESNGRVTLLTASRPAPGFENTLYVSQEELELLSRTIDVLGGSLRYVPASVMSTPNQPAGASEAIMKLWTRFFPMRGGHWGGWDLQTYPAIGRIEFTNAERTRASVPVTIGYSGGTVILEKTNGEWRPVEIVNRWIT